MITHNEQNNDNIELLKSINNCYKNKSKQIEENDNILIKYIKDNNIIKDKKLLSLFINELLIQINEGNNIILPFIDACYNLIEAYCDNINDDEIIYNNFLDKKIFIKLIENSFINRKILNPIYSYFTELYSDVEKIKESDEKLNNLSKIIELWKLFYNEIKINKVNNKNHFISSFCFLGSGLELYGIDKLPKNLYLKFKINFKNSNFLKYVNKNDFFIKIEDSNCYITYSKLLEFNINSINSIDLDFKCFNKIITIDIYINSKIFLNDFKIPINISFKKINILNNFYGQIYSMDYYIYECYHNNKNKREKDHKEIIPFPLKGNNGIIFFSEFKYNSENIFTINDNTGINSVIPEYYNNIEIKIELKIKDKNLVKANYINYKENNFSVLDYFGGITQFLPFLNIINGLYKNKNIQYINTIEKEKFLIEFSQNIITVIFKNISGFKKEKRKKIKKYWNFYLYILNKIELFKSEKIKININEFELNKKNNKHFFKMFIDYFNYINDKNEENEVNFKKSVLEFYNKKKNNQLNLFVQTNNQIYRNKMKQLFVFNRLWSKQYLFFENVNNCYKKYNNKNIKIKYKRLNYYTTNFQQPLIYPILEINNYYPSFKNFKSENLYKNNEDNVLNYDFSLDKFNNNLNDKYVNNFLDNNNIFKTYKCCLVKKMYHIKGNMGIVIPKNKDNFILLFSCIKENEIKCNKNDKNKNEYNPHLCYGSVFSCLNKDLKRIILFPKEKIIFIIMRIYYYRPKAFEIFTTDNKSYYFNFMEDFIYENKNLIFLTLNRNFKEIDVLDGKIFLGWYNPKYSKVLNPLFNTNIDDWADKNYYYSNFDKLMIINLFSNRSFNDLNQYPVFPMLYKVIDKERNMEQPIGFQDLTDKSKSRKDLIIESYNYEKNYQKDDEDEKNEISFFNLFYSNITYTCNFLIRIFPYSFIAIEYQGDGFDDPNRLFFSINSTFHNTLEQRSDLRELIPEIFYFPPLFYNRNDIQLKKLSTGKEIDNVIINDWKENDLKKYIFLRDMREELEKEKKLNLWIDLIFGVNMEYRENNGEKERYYSKNSTISFDLDERNLKYDDKIILQSYDFGVLPFKLFNKKFPEKQNISTVIQREITILNEKIFNEDHINVLINGKESFICKGEKGINDEYLKIIEKAKSYNFSFKSILVGIQNVFIYKNNEDNENNSNQEKNLKYLFIGDVYGNLHFYKEKEKKQHPIISNNKLEEINMDKKIIEKLESDYELYESLTDHSSEIKYIDYNPRLNLVIDYALDGYINIYTVPKFKLIKAIQAKDFNTNNEIIKYLVLISNPFPMICCICNSNLFVLDINGVLINTIKIKENVEFKFCIDKNCGLFNDYISFYNKGKWAKINLLNEK